MWQRFTQNARKTVFYAQEEANAHSQSYVGPEHLLLGLLKDGDNTAAKVLAALDVSREKVRIEILERLSDDLEAPTRDMTLTHRAKRVIDLAYDSARKLKNDYIGTGHLLLGLIREDGGASAVVFKKFGVTFEKAKQAMIAAQAAKGGTAVPEPEPEEPKIGYRNRAQMVETYAREAARTVGEGCISTEHILLGLMRDPLAMSARVLERLGVTPDAMRAEIDRRTATYRGTSWNMRTVSRVQRVLDLTVDEALSEGAEEVGTSHYLLALLREAKGIAAKALAKLGLDEAKVREARQTLRAQASERE